MNTDRRDTPKLRLIGPLFAIPLMACSAPPVEYDISPRAMAALPAGQNLEFVHRGTDGCYSYIKEDKLSGYQIPLTDDAGPVCDDVFS